MTTIKPEPVPPSTFYADAGTTLLAVVPALLAGSQASWYWLALGGLAWALCLPVKFGVSALLSLATGADGSEPTSRGGVTVYALSLGIVSAASELGMAAIVFLKAEGHLVDAQAAVILAFAIGAASTETLLVQVASKLTVGSDLEQVERWIDGARASRLVQNSLFFERLLAVTGHIGSRSLLGLSLVTGSPWPVCVAAIGFTLTDGLAAYGGLRGWDFFSPVTFRRFCVACALIVLGELAALSIFLVR